MTPRQRDVAWALGIIFALVTMFNFLLGNDSVWMGAALAVMGAWWVYYGGRTAFDKKYYDYVHAEQKARAERNNLEYVDKKADWGSDLWNMGPGYWSMRMMFMGFICLLIGFAMLFPR